MENYYIKDKVCVCDECNKRVNVLWMGKNVNDLYCPECYINNEFIYFIEQMAYNKSIDYKPFEENLHYSEYFKCGFEEGFKRAIEYFFQEIKS